MPGACSDKYNPGQIVLTQKPLSLNDVSIVSVKGNDDRIHFLYRSKYEVLNLLRNADLTQKSGTL